MAAKACAAAAGRHNKQRKPIGHPAGPTGKPRNAEGDNQ